MSRDEEESGVGRSFRRLADLPHRHPGFFAELILSVAEGLKNDTGTLVASRRPPRIATKPWPGAEGPWPGRSLHLSSDGSSESEGPQCICSADECDRP